MKESGRGGIEYETFKKKKLFIYLAAWGLSCSTRGLCCLIQDISLQLRLSSGGGWAQ